MTDNVFKDVLTKGVPTRHYLSISILLDDIVSICKHSDIKDYGIHRIREFKKFINEIGGNVLFPLNLNYWTTIYTNEQTLERKLIFDTCIIENIFLNTFDFVTKKKYTAEDILALIAQLRNINDEEKLKENFPKVYNIYLLTKKNNNTLLQIKTFLNNYYNIPRQRLFEIVASRFNITTDTVVDDLKFADPNFNLDTFCAKMSNFLENIFLKRDEIYKYCIDNPLEFKINEKDKDKLELYIAYCHLSVAKELSKEEQQSYLYYLSTYFYENSDKLSSKFKIFLPNEDVIVSISKLYDEYKKLLVDNPQLRIIDFKSEDFNGMTLDEVEEFMEEYFKDISANWDFFDDADSLDKDFTDWVDRYYKKRGGGQLEDNEKIIIQKFIEKKKFFDSSDPYYRIKGKNTFDGYIGYIYSNGTVVLEKFFEDYEKGIIAKNQAIYVMHIDDFYNLSKLSKNKIIANKLCKRFIHKGDWQSRVLKEINKTTNSSPEYVLNDLMKKGIKK